MASAANRVEHGRTALRSLLTNALPAWKSLSEQLGMPGLVRETGHFVVWESAASAAAGLAAWRSTDIGSARFHECDADEMRQLAGLMKQAPAGAIRFENTAQIADLPKLADSPRTSITARNGRIVNAQARSVAHRERSVSVTLDDGSTAEADFAVVSAGVRSRELMEPYCKSVPIIAERGYHLQITDHRWPDLPPVVFEDRSMIVTRFESGLRAASFVRIRQPRCAARYSQVAAPAQSCDGARPALQRSRASVDGRAPNIAGLLARDWAPAPRTEHSLRIRSPTSRAHARGYYRRSDRAARDTFADGREPDAPSICNVFLRKLVVADAPAERIIGIEQQLCVGSHMSGAHDGRRDRAFVAIDPAIVPLNTLPSTLSCVHSSPSASLPSAARHASFALVPVPQGDRSQALPGQSTKFRLRAVGVVPSSST